jgi:Signal transduction histidine kinase regulating C4-dicarboxylate transport system
MTAGEIEKKSQQTVLLVDDDSVNLAVFGKCLSDAYSVLIATSGERALEIARGEQKPDLILLDIMMPGMDGYEVIQHLKADPNTQDIPVIFITALTSDVDETRGLELGAADYIYKPCSLAILSARVRAQIELKRTQDLLRDQNASLEAELEKRLRENQLFQLELLQSEKLAAIGQLAAGVAHEVNNPLGFIYSNLNTLQDYSRTLFAFMDDVDGLIGQEPQNQGLLAKIRGLYKHSDLDFVRKDMLELIVESRDGLARVRNIMQNLNKFSEGNTKEWQLADINECMDATLGIFQNDQSVQCVLEKNYGDVPTIHCIPSRINQAFLSLLINASQAIENGGTISVSTGCNDQQVWAEIADNGYGIAPENLAHLFEPFFTTRPIGKGIGLGLSTTEAIVRAHHGRIEVNSKVGQGSSFKIWLPIQQAS